MIGPFQSTLMLGIFLVVFLMWCVSLLIEPFIIKKAGTRTVKSREDKGTYYLIHLTVLFSLIISFNLGFNEITLLPIISSYIGILFIVGGIFLREYSIVTLGKYFSFKISVVKDQKIITKGPYHFIRHPSYSGGILAILGIAIALRSMIAIVVVTLLCSITYGLRIRFEERIMLAEFGEDYLIYKRKTKRVIPFIY